MNIGYKSGRWIPSILLLAACTSAYAGSAFRFESTPGKLPKTIIPEHYTIELRPDLSAKQVSGSEAIDIKVMAPSDRIVLNAVNTEIKSVTLDGATIATQTTDTAAQTVTFALPSRIAAGAHKLRLSFASHINEFGQGMFRVKYPTESGDKQMIATQLEPADARRIFPCWDEPAFKAVFDTAVVVPDKFMAVSNMPVAHEEPAGEGFKRVVFAATPPMSSYLFVLVAGELERLSGDADGVTVGVVAQAGKSEHGRFALNSAMDLLRYYNGYFGIKYPLPKLDLIAVPGGFGGAMENWGGITFHSGILLYDAAASPKVLQRRIFAVVAHEMAHQWFGDLVTTAWWSDLWLNEGFADWMAAKVEDKLHPEWAARLNDPGKQAAMYADARSMTHPIQQSIGDESEAQSAFDEITYEKGAAIIRLVEGYVGEDHFRDGIRRYVKGHAYSNATTSDLWTALEQTSGKSVSAIARGYTEQAGMPLIIVDEHCRDGQGTLALKQEHFTIHYPDAPPGFWQVPLAWGTLTDAAASGSTLLKTQSAEIAAGACGPRKLNFGDTGYYRTQYDSATLAALTKAFKAMQPPDRVNLIGDYWALLEAGRAAARDYFPIVEAAGNDQKRAVWREIISTLQRIDRLERGAPGRSMFQTYGRAVLRPPFQRLRWDAKPGETEDDAILRASLISALGDFGDSEIAAEAKRRFDVFRKSPESLDPNLRDAVAGVVGRFADSETYDVLHELGRHADNLRDRRRYYGAMARATNPELAEKTLRITLTDELPPEAASELIMIVAAGENSKLALDFALKHFDELAATRGPDFRHFFMSRLMAAFASRADAEALKHFAPANETSGGRIEALRAEARILESADFREHQLLAIDEWVKSRSAIRP
jgi:aminopeptidase N